MTVRWTLPAVAIAALMAPGPAGAQDPAPEPAPAERQRVARPRAEGAESKAPAVRESRPADRGENAAQEAQPRIRRAVPEPAATPVVPVANAEQQGGVRNPRSAGGGGRTSGGGGRTSGGGDGSSAGTVRPRAGGVRSPVSGGGRGVESGTRDDSGQVVTRRAVPRSVAPLPPGPVHVTPYHGYGRQYYNPGGFGYYYYDPWIWYGFGWPGYAPYWAGYYGSVPYYYGYGPGYGYGYGAPYYGSAITAYGGPHGWSIGGVRLKVEPNDAEVYVDGYYAGVVDDFDGMWQQLRLDDGGHRIEVRKPGMETLTFEVMIQPGRTITHRGRLTPTP
jgi:hypothetical protein